MSVLVVGSVALDSIKTPFGKRDDILGGSATFFSIAASFFNKVDMVAAVGEDFPRAYIDIFRRRGIGLDGLTVSPGKTFRWKGFYEYDLNTAHTLSTHLNVFRDFDPKVPKHLCRPDILFLANIDPGLQRNVLTQVKRPRLVACDSMNYWIQNKRSCLVSLLKSVDIFLVNDAGEAAERRIEPDQGGSGDTEAGSEGRRHKEGRARGHILFEKSALRSPGISSGEDIRSDRRGRHVRRRPHRLPERRKMRQRCRDPQRHHLRKRHGLVHGGGLQRQQANRHNREGYREEVRPFQGDNQVLN